MYKYGITQKCGDSQVIQSKLDIEKFMEYLKSAKWVAVNFIVPSNWTNPGDKDVNFLNIMISLDNIQTISFIESED